MKSTSQVFKNVLDVRRPEVDRVLLMSIYLLLIIAAYSTAKAVRDSLFITKIGPAQLPYVYLVIAIGMAGVSMVYSRAANRVGLHGLIRATSLIAISSLLVFWLGFSSDSALWFYGLYVWTSIFGAITASQFWLLATHVFNPREARRVFPSVGIGGILGGVLGGALTNRMVHRFGTESLLLICAAMMSVTLVILSRLKEFGRPVENSSDASVPGGAVLPQIRGSRHLTTIIILLSVAVIVEALIDYEYKVVAQQSIASKDHLTAFFGSVTFWIGILSLLFQLLVTTRVLKRFGVGPAILFLPASLLGAFVAVALKPALWTAAMLQVVDGGLSYSIHRSGMELLYLPIPPQTRNAVKGFIDLFVDRAGRAAGALLLLLFTAGLGLSIPALSTVACALVLVWLSTATIAKREYLHSFRRGLEKKTIEPEAVQLQDADRSTIHTLKSLLSSEDERQVLYALDLLSNTHPDRWYGSIDALIRHPSGVIRARTIAMLSSWNHPAIARKEFVGHPDFETARLASAGVLRLQWTGSVRNRERLNGLLHDPSPAVRREAIVTAGAVAHREAIPMLIETLVDRNLRREARLALLGFGRAVIPELVRRLSDSAESFAVRRHIPKTLALTGKQEAADALAQGLHRLDYHLDFAVLKALNRMRVNSPGIVVDGEFAAAAIRKEREEYDRLTSLQVWLEAHPIDDRIFAILLRALAERRQQRVERVFRLVGLIYPPNDISAIHYNCRLKPALRPAAIEFLDNILAPELKETVVPLLEDSFAGERASHVQQPIELRSIAEALSILRNSEDPWLIMIASRLEESLQSETMSRDTVPLSAIDTVLCLQSVDIFKHMTTEMLAYIGAIAQELSVPGQHVIFSEDDISDAMYVVARGRIRLAKVGKEILVVEAGESFGTWALFDNQPRMMTATALEESQLLKIRSENFYDLLSDHGEITPVVFRAVIERMNRLIPD